MHLMSPQFTTTNTRKRKAKNKTKSQIQAEKDHEKFLKRMGVHPEQRGLRKGRSVSGSTSVSKTERVGSIPTSSASIGYHPTMAKKKENVYTGTEIIGIATMHKSNAVPIRGKKAAEEVAKMRRG
jgi:hypothetical protein